MAKRAPKFKVGQVVYFAERRSYVTVTARFEVAAGHRILQWQYNIAWGFGWSVHGVDERKLRRLYKREVGEVH